MDLALATPDGNLARAKASPLLFNYRLRALEFLSAWIDQIDHHRRRGSMTFDHEPMLEVLTQFKDRTHIVDVGPDYCTLEDKRNSCTVISMGVSTSESKVQALRQLQGRARRLPAIHRDPQALRNRFYL